LREIRRIRERLPNVLILKVGEVGEEILDRSAGRERLDDHADSYAHAPDTRLSAHNLGIGGYPAELLHVVGIALNPVWNCSANAAFARRGTATVIGIGRAKRLTGTDRSKPPDVSACATREAWHLIRCYTVACSISWQASAGFASMMNPELNWFDQSALLERLSNALPRRPQRVVFLVGSPLSFLEHRKKAAFREWPESSTL
jgi:hypothetical protein